MSEQKTEEVPLAPIQALVIGTGADMATGDGTIAGDDKKQVIVTPHGLPDIVVTVISPLLAIIARAGNVFFQTLVGLIVIGPTGLIPVNTWRVSVLIAATAGVVCVLQSLVTIFSNLEKKFPLLRA